MTLKEFAGVDSWYRDVNTGIEITWHDYMGRVIEKLGLDNIKPYIPFDLDYIKKAIENDIHLNNTKLASWMYAAGFMISVNRKTQAETVTSLHCGIATLFVSNGITCFSPSDGVSVLKETARILCEVY